MLEWNRNNMLISKFAFKRKQPRSWFCTVILCFLLCLNFKFKCSEESWMITFCFVRVLLLLASLARAFDAACAVGAPKCGDACASVSENPHFEFFLLIESKAIWFYLRIIEMIFVSCIREHKCQHFWLSIETKWTKLKHLRALRIKWLRPARGVSLNFWPLPTWQFYCLRPFHSLTIIRHFSVFFKQIKLIIDCINYFIHRHVMYRRMQYNRQSSYRSILRVLVMQCSVSIVVWTSRSISISTSEL